MFGSSLVIMEKYSERIINELQERCMNVWNDNTMVGSLFITLVRARWSGLTRQSSASLKRKLCVLFGLAPPPTPDPNTLRSCFLRSSSIFCPINHV